MATTHPTASVRDALCNHIVDQLDGGTIELQIAGNTEVATLTFGTPAFDDAGSTGGNATGVAEANTITPESSATGNATAVTIGQLKASGGTVIVQCSVGTSGTDIILSSDVIAAGETVDITQLSYESAP